MLGLVTAEVAAPLDPDLLPLDAVLRARLGDDAVAIVSWDDPTVDWAAFDAVAIRSTWNYMDHLEEFVAWVDRAAAETTLVNAPDVIRWSLDKRYLADLGRAGIPITPTTFVAPGEPPPVVEGLHVVKPTVGAGSNGARRCEPAEVADHVAFLHRNGRTAMVQPYLDLLDERGETALCFVVDASGEFELSHAFRKGAILTSTDVEQKGDLFAAEDITGRVPSAEELDLATQVLGSDAVAALGDIVFARVDIAPLRAAPDGAESYGVMELELIEPSFYFATSDGSVESFADRLVGWLEQRCLLGLAPDGA